MIFRVELHLTPPEGGLTRAIDDSTRWVGDVEIGEYVGPTFMPETGDWIRVGDVKGQIHERIWNGRCDAVENRSKAERPRPLVTLYLGVWGRTGDLESLLRAAGLHPVEVLT